MLKCEIWNVTRKYVLCFLLMSNAIQPEKDQLRCPPSNQKLGDYECSLAWLGTGVLPVYQNVTSGIVESHALNLCLLSGCWFILKNHPASLQIKMAVLYTITMEKIGVTRWLSRYSPQTHPYKDGRAHSNVALWFPHTHHDAYADTRQ